MELKLGDEVSYPGCSTPGHERPASYGKVYSILCPDPQGRTTVFVEESDGTVRPHWAHQLKREQNAAGI